jgi:hypothetical protein
MYSIEVDTQIIVGNSYKMIDELAPHEEVVKERALALVDYLESLNSDLIVPSIIVCSKTYMIIDGHHRVSALKEMGFSSLPCTFIDYSSEQILTGKALNSISKESLLDACGAKKLFPPKTTCHQILDLKGNMHPLILISNLHHMRRT